MSVSPLISANFLLVHFIPSSTPQPHVNSGEKERRGNQGSSWESGAGDMKFTSREGTGNSHSIHKEFWLIKKYFKIWKVNSGV